MKRLLVYLFLVLGLGLTFSVSANAKSLELCWKSLSGDKVWVTKEKNWSRGGSGCKRIHKSENAKLYKEINKNLFKTSLTFNKNKKKKIYSIRKINLQNILKNHNKNWNSWLYPNTKIAKAEPSQTQKVAKKDISRTTKMLFCDGVSPGYASLYSDKNSKDFGSFGILALSKEIYSNCKGRNYNGTEIAYKDVLKKYPNIRICYRKGFPSITSFQLINSNWNCKKNFPQHRELKFLGGDEFYFESEIDKIQIAKAEPSQTQKVAEKTRVNLKFCSASKDKVLGGDGNWSDGNYSIGGYALLTSQVGYECWYTFEEFKNRKIKFSDNKFCISNDSKNIIYSDAEYCNLNNTSNVKYNKLIFSKKKKFADYEFLVDSNHAQITKAETTVKPKKKVKVAKVEPKQEEFKPKKTNQDNEAPVITIAEVITVNDSSYEFKGKVIDKAKTIYVEVDGRSVDVKKGQFIVKGYSPIDKEISITAIDQWGNRSEPKIVKLTIDVMNSSFDEVLEPLNASKIKTKSSNNKVALIIGIEQYEQSPKASYANLDAKYFFDYARKAFGVKKQNIKMLIDQEASLSKTNSAIFKWLPGKITANETDLIIFFSGHGLASSDGKAKYILPSNADPDLLSRTALSRSELFDEIIKLNPKSVTMFFDTCYSGVSRDEQTLLAAAKPLRGVVDDDNKVPDNFTIFTASKGDQISSGLKEAKHGIFSYYLMKGLEGKADANKDKDITNGELRAYMVKNVSDKALDLGRQQTPVLSGDPDKILMSYR